MEEGGEQEEEEEAAESGGSGGGHFGLVRCVVLCGVLLICLL